MNNNFRSLNQRMDTMDAQIRNVNERLNSLSVEDHVSKMTNDSHST